MRTRTATPLRGLKEPVRESRLMLRNPARRGPVVLATEGTSENGAVVLAAQLLAARLDVPLEVASVLEPTPIQDGVIVAAALYDPALDEARSDSRETLVRDYVARFGGGAPPPRVHVRFGAVAHEIAQFARQISATVVVLGSAPHLRLRRTVSGERATHVLRAADCPVLTVPPTFTGLPRTVIAAVDFGPSSVRAAQAGLLTLAEGGTLVLTHVMPPTMSPPALSSPPADAPETNISLLFERLREELTPYVPAGARIETRLVTDDPVDGILTSADQVGADLIAVGTHGPGLFARLFLGSVAGSVIHAAEQAILASPPPAPQEALELWRRIAGVAATDRSNEWSAALDDFTRRNVGRDVLLEVEEPETGARVTSFGYELVGVTFEPSARRVEIMVGDASKPLRHVTRSVCDPDEITLTVTPSRRGEVLDVRHGKGHTVVTVVDRQDG